MGATEDFDRVVSSLPDRLQGEKRIALLQVAGIQVFTMAPLDAGCPNLDPAEVVTGGRRLSQMGR
jgi:hypothetical protein